MMKLMTALCLVALVASGATAEVLWDQSNWLANGDGFLNNSATSCSMISGETKMHTAMDVSFATDVFVQSITIYETYGNDRLAMATQAYLWIAPKTGSLPTAASNEVNNAANLVSISSVTVVKDGIAGMEVTASGLAIDLAAGDYWVSLTPVHNRGIYPYSVHCFSADGVVGDPTPVIVACTVNSDWIYRYAPDINYDTALKIEGTAAVIPADDTQWGGVKALYR